MAGSVQLGQTSFSRFLRCWFYYHGRYCAKHPRVAAGIGIIVVLLGALGLLNPRGQPFVFNLQASMDDFWSYVHQYAIPRWHAGAYLLLAAHVAWAADSGVKYPVLKRARSVLGLKTLEERVSRKMRRNSQPWSPSFAARFTVGLCGILVVLFSVLLACAVSNSLLGVSMAAVFDELPFLVLFMGVHSVFSLLDASTSTYNETEYHEGVREVVVVDRVNQIALATSLSGPEELLTSLTKAALALLFCWPLTSVMGASMEPVANFWVHAGLAVLFKCLLQMSVFASLVQTMLPEWDPARRRTCALLTPDIKCRVCFETGLDLRRCPCKCTGSVGYIHPVCFQQWFETKKSMRCELCHMIFNIRMLPTSVTTNMQTIESLLVDLVPPLTRRLVLLLALSAALLCNKLGVMVFDAMADKVRYPLRALAHRQSHAGSAADKDLLVYLVTLGVLAMPAVLAALVGVVPRVLTEWHRRHRVMHWDGPITDCSVDSDDESDDGDDDDTLDDAGGMAGDAADRKQDAGCLEGDSLHASAHVPHVAAKCCSEGGAEHARCARSGLAMEAEAEEKAEEKAEAEAEAEVDAAVGHGFAHVQLNDKCAGSIRGGGAAKEVGREAEAPDTEAPGDSKRADARPARQRQCRETCASSCGDAGRAAKQRTTDITTAASPGLERGSEQEMGHDLTHENAQCALSAQATCTDAQAQDLRQCGGHPSLRRDGGAQLFVGRPT